MNRSFGFIVASARLSVLLAALLHLCAAVAAPSVHAQSGAGVGVDAPAVELPERDEPPAHDDRTCGFCQASGHAALEPVGSPLEPASVLRVRDPHHPAERYSPPTRVLSHARAPPAAEFRNRARA